MFKSSNPMSIYFEKNQNDQMLFCDGLNFKVMDITTLEGAIPLANEIQII